MRRFIDNLSLKKKIQGIVFATILLLSLAALFSIHLITTAYDKMLYKATASSLSISSTEMANSLENLNTMADLILADPTIQTNLSTLKDVDNPQQITVAYNALYSTLSEYYFSFRKDNINNMSLYQNNYSVHTYLSSYKPMLPKEVELDLRQRAEDARGATIWVTDYSTEYGLFLVKSIRRTEYLRLDSIGTLMVNINLDGLVSDSSAPGFLQEGSSYLLFDKEHLLYSSSVFPAEALTDYTEAADSPYMSLSFDGQDYFCVKSKIPSFGWDYVCSIPYNVIRSSLDTSFRLCILIITATLIIAVIMSSALINSITRHFDNLLIKIRNFGDGNQEPVKIDYNYDNRTDELGILHRQFDRMVDQVNQLIRTNYLNEILIKEAQFKALENQMNPHFLYNTLESINWRAKMLGARDISSMAENLGTLLRITLHQSNTHIPLREELDLIQCYMTIQKHRYENRLDYRVLVPEELMDCSVLKLTLQPLVENSIRYGLEENTDCCIIQVSAEADSDRNLLLLYVKNDGSCFEDDLIHKLETHEVEPHGFGIGLLNIRKRMQITFGETYGLELYNEDELAVVKLTYPLTYYRKE